MSEKVRITVKTERVLLLPTLPNFIRTENDEAVPIADLTRDQLREIGQQWTEALLRKADDKRDDRIRALNRAIQETPRCPYPLT